MRTRSPLPGTRPLSHVARFDHAPLRAVRITPSGSGAWVALGPLDAKAKAIQAMKIGREIRSMNHSHEAGRFELHVQVGTKYHLYRDERQIANKYAAAAGGPAVGGLADGPCARWSRLHAPRGSGGQLAEPVVPALLRQSL